MQKVERLVPNINLTGLLTTVEWLAQTPSMSSGSRPLHFLLWALRNSDCVGGTTALPSLLPALQSEGWVERRLPGLIAIDPSSRKDQGRILMVKFWGLQCLWARGRKPSFSLGVQTRAWEEGRETVRLTHPGSLPRRTQPEATSGLRSRWGLYFQLPGGFNKYIRCAW